MSVETLTLIIFGLVLLQVVAGAGVWLFRRVRNPPQPKAVVKAVQPMMPSASSTATDGWEGFREFKVERRIYEDESHSICSFYLIPVDGTALPLFRPGQFLTFKLARSDRKESDLKPLVRCYSLSDRPGQDYYRISVKRQLAPADERDLPPGAGSNFLHDHVIDGTRLSVRAPSGHFYLMEEELIPVVLVGGGIGITPMLSILNTLLDSGSRREIYLFYGVRNGSQHIMKAHLETLSKEYPNFHLHVCYSRPAESDLEGVDYHHQGHVDIQLLRLTLKRVRHQFYICGSKPMMETLVPALEEWGVDDNDIHYESFGPASLAKRDKPKPLVDEVATGQNPTITFSQSEKVIHWDPMADSLLNLAEENGIEVDSGCRAGSCGCCQVPIETGEVEYSQEPDAEIEPGHCLLCIATPKNNITLSA
ncbi:MAG: 2Fe-2S iron-sulfur cluster-binding protein [Sedimenticola sp.]